MRSGPAVSPLSARSHWPCKWQGPAACTGTQFLHKPDHRGGHKHQHAGRQKKATEEPCNKRQENDPFFGSPKEKGSLCGQRHHQRPAVRVTRDLLYLDSMRGTESFQMSVAIAVPQINFTEHFPRLRCCGKLYGEWPRVVARLDSRYQAGRTGANVASGLSGLDRGVATRSNVPRPY